MKKKKISKKILVGIIVLCLILTIAIIVIILKNNTPEQSAATNKTNNEEIKYNTNEGIIEDKQIDNILFSDIECSFDGNTSLLTYKITNNQTESIYLEEYEIIVKDKNDNILAIIAPSITEEIKPNETIETGNVIDIDLTNAYKFELTLNNE